MQTVLIVDDSKFILTLLEDRISERLEVNILKAKSFQEAKEYIDKEEIIHVAILDLNLPDAEDGEIVDYAISKHIPSIILTGLMNNEIKNTIIKKDIIDYVYKNNRNSIEYTINIINRVLSNYTTNILVVDDSNLRHPVEVSILKKMKFNVTMTSELDTVLDLIKNGNESYSMVLLDDTKNHLDGIELTLSLRQLYKRDQLSIIVLGSNESSESSSEFIKFGANDFIKKPFTEIEFTSRINSSLDLIDSFKKSKSIANRDYLSGAFNRRFLFDSGNSIFKKAKRKNEEVVVAMLDIDHFKSINDHFGHDIGDLAIKRTVKILNECLRDSDLMVRFGGEEFCILLEHISQHDTLALFERIRVAFEKNIMPIDEKSLSFSVSIGICYGMEQDLETMIKKSDDSLYYAKENGRNQVAFNKDFKH